MRLLLLFLMCWLTITLIAAQPTATSLNQDPVFKAILTRRLSYPEEAVRSGIYANLYAAFQINTKGHIRDVHILNPVVIGFGLEQKVINALKKLPPLHPRYEGSYALPVTFALFNSIDSNRVVRALGHLPASYLADRTLLHEFQVTADQVIYQPPQLVSPAKAGGQSFVIKP